MVAITQEGLELLIESIKRFSERKLYKVLPENPEFKDLEREFFNINKELDEVYGNYEAEKNTFNKSDFIYYKKYILKSLSHLPDFKIKCPDFFRINSETHPYFENLENKLKNFLKDINYHLLSEKFNKI